MFKNACMRLISIGLITLFVLSACSSKDNGKKASSSPSQSGNSAATAKEPEIPKVKVRFGNSEFVDHTDISIAVKNGWLEEVGIELADPNVTYSPGDHAAILQAGSVDVQSSNFAILLPAFVKSKNLRMFVNGDYFLGFAVIGNAKFTSYEEFVKQGLSSEEALKKTVDQMRGKKFVMSTDPAIRGFAQNALKSGGAALKDMSVETLGEAEGVQLMLSGRSDFQVGGAPSRLTLGKSGFKAILTAGDLASTAKQGDSSALGSVIPNGWATTDEYYKNNKDTVMRLASVKWRIDQYVNEHSAEAAKIQVKALNRIAGLNLTEQDVAATYANIDPFIPFERQGALWYDSSKPTYDTNIYKAWIAQSVKGGSIPQGTIKAEEVSVAEQVYKQAVEYKTQADSLIKDAESLVKDKQAAQNLLNKAKHFYEIYDFQDAASFAKAAAEVAKN